MNTYQTERYQVIREPDGRGVVIDAQNFFVWVFGPTSIETCLKIADEMNRDEKNMKTLARKGEVTVVEHVGKKTTVAVKASGNVATLQGWATKEQLIAELCQIVKNWPDINP